jgi:hypothetical protein
VLLSIICCEPTCTVVEALGKNHEHPRLVSVHWQCIVKLQDSAGILFHHQFSEPVCGVGDF